MSSKNESATNVVDLHGVEVDYETRGAGRDILFLSSGMWFGDEAPCVEALARLGRVIAPVHPGFGARPAPPRFNSADDLAYVYLDLAEKLRLRDVLVVGASFGGWIAAEMATKSCADVAGLALIDPLGVKIGDRDARDIADLFAIPDGELKKLAWRDPTRFNDDIPTVTDAELTRRVRARESLARYGWQPFMHNPKLPGRLHRVACPALFLWGAHDHVVTPAYGRAYAALTPGARFVEIADAGHFPHVEQMSATMDALSAFARAPAAPR